MASLHSRILDYLALGSLETFKEGNNCVVYLADKLALPRSKVLSVLNDLEASGRIVVERRSGQIMAVRLLKSPYIKSRDPYRSAGDVPSLLTPQHRKYGHLVGPVKVYRMPTEEFKEASMENDVIDQQNVLGHEEMILELSGLDPTKVEQFQKSLVLAYRLVGEGDFINERIKEVRALLKDELKLQALPYSDVALFRITAALEYLDLLIVNKVGYQGMRLIVELEQDAPDPSIMDAAEFLLYEELKSTKVLKTGPLAVILELRARRDPGRRLAIRNLLSELGLSQSKTNEALRSLEESGIVYLSNVGPGPRAIDIAWELVQVHQHESVLDLAKPTVKPAAKAEKLVADKPAPSLTLGDIVKGVESLKSENEDLRKQIAEKEAIISQLQSQVEALSDSLRQVKDLLS